MGLIVADPDPVLREVAVRVQPKTVREIVQRMKLAMQESAEAGRPAAGIAAPQVGESVRVFLLADDPVPFVNPVIVRRSKDTDVQDEGCLSLPETMLVPVRRSLGVTVAAQDTKGKARIVNLFGYAARVAQHEIDHLDGKLISDYAVAQAAVA